MPVDHPSPQPPRKPSGVLTRLRNWFLAGAVVAAPLAITLWLMWSVVVLVDTHIVPLIPQAWNPETYLSFELPGLGIITAVIFLTLLGALITNLAGQQALRLGELLLARVPLVRSIYSILKQVVETIAANDSSSFKEAVLVEYPGKGLWVIGFITSRTPDAEVLAQAPDVIGVLVPSSPNPAMGQLVFVTPERIRPLDMPVEKAARLVISFGIRSADQVEAGLRSVQGK
ncbi:MAG: DUF502 domain-containing protein [Hyphomonadaceae bacterium]